MDMLKLFIHVVLFVVSGFTVGYDYLKNDVGSKRPWGRFKYLTFWNICLQTIYFGFSIFTDLTERRSNPPRPNQRCTVQKFRDILHSCFAFPSAMFVTVYFWALYSVDRHFVWPVEYDSLLPSWLKHLLHTTVLVFIVLDKLIVRHHYLSAVNGILANSLVAITYGVWFYYIYHASNSVLEILGVQWQAVFFLSNIISSATSYLMGKWLSTYLWGHAPILEKDSDKMKTN